MNGRASRRPDMRLNDLVTSLHDWRIGRRMERAFKNDPEPYRPPSSSDRLRFAAAMALVGDRRYRRGLDVGCAEGALTRDLAARCDSLVGVDVSETAVFRAMVNLADVPNVRLLRGNVRSYLQEVGWDLIVLSDVLPHLDAGPRWSRAVGDACAALARNLLPGGRLIAVTSFKNGAQYERAEAYLKLFLRDGVLSRSQQFVGGDCEGGRFLAASLERRPVPVALPAGRPAARLPTTMRFPSRS